MVIITTQVSSSYVLVIKHFTSNDYKTQKRRVSRVSTLDGGSVTSDSGYTDTDRTLTIKAKLTEAQVETIQYMHENYSLWDVSISGEFFSCAHPLLKTPGGVMELQLLVAE